MWYRRFTFIVICLVSWGNTEVTKGEAPTAIVLIGRPHQHPDNIITSLAFSANGLIIVTGHAGGAIRVWDRTSGKLVQEFAGTPIAIAVSISLDSQLIASAFWDKLICVWDLRAKKQRKRLLGHEGPAVSLAFSPDEQFLASGGTDHIICMWNSTSGKLAWKSPSQKGSIEALWFTPDGRRLVSACEDGSVAFWDTNNGKLLSRLDQRGFPIVFAPEANLLAYVVRRGDRTQWAEVWSVSKRSVVCTIPLEENDRYCLAISRDGQLLALSGLRHNTIVSLWEIGTGKLIRSLEDRKPARPFLSLSFSWNGRYLACASGATAATVWDLAQWENNHRLQHSNMDQLWESLASGDPSTAYRAIAILTSMPHDALRLLTKRLTPVTSVKREETKKLIAALDNRVFQTREQASKTLLMLGEGIETTLSEHLKSPRSPEQSRRISHILHLVSIERRRQGRALVALNYIGTTDVVPLLKRLASGAPEAPLTREATMSLSRLSIQLRSRDSIKIRDR